MVSTLREEKLLRESHWKVRFAFRVVWFAACGFLIIEGAQLVFSNQSLCIVISLVTQ